MPAPFTPDDLVGQFILSKRDGDLPPGWPARQLGAWRLAVHPTLPVFDIRAQGGAHVGWLLGYPISPEGRLVDGPVRCPASGGAADFTGQFETWLYAHGGRFAAVLLADTLKRVYLDACGLLAAVHCPPQQIVASTPTLIPRTADCGDAIIPEIQITAKGGWYPFGLTPRRNVERLIPNHYLDLDAWQAVRHWPKGEIEPILDTQTAIAELAAIIKRTIAAVACDHAPYMGLTAGRDSRILLACSRGLIDRIEFITAIVPRFGASWLDHPAVIDQGIARRLARHFALRHRVLPYLPITKADASQWHYRTGGCVGSFMNQRTSRQIDNCRPAVGGVGGELCRGYHWRRGDDESSVIDGADLVRRRDLPDVEPLRQRSKQWLAALPVRNALTIWGLYHIEQMMGCWSGPAHYGFAHGAFYISPFVHRRAMEIMLALPADYRRACQADTDLVASQWPELLRYPCNWPVGLRRYACYVNRRLRLIGRKVSGILGGRLHPVRGQSAAPAGRQLGGDASR